MAVIGGPRSVRASKREIRHAGWSERRVTRFRASAVDPVAINVVELRDPMAGVAAVTFKVAPRSGLHVTTHLLRCPLPREAIAFGEGDRVVTWPSGSEVALVDRHNSEVVQVVVVRPVGLMLNLHSFSAVPAKARPPLSFAGLEALAHRLDSDEVEAALLASP
jgi:hypothetical protein